MPEQQPGSEPTQPEVGEPIVHGEEALLPAEPPQPEVGEPIVHGGEAPLPAIDWIARATPAIGDLSYLTFTCFNVALLVFTGFTDTVLCIVVMRANNRNVGFPASIEALNYLCVALHTRIFSDLFYQYFRFYRPRENNAGIPMIRDSEFPKPRSWRCIEAIMQPTELAPRSFLLLLALSLPLNVLLFYDGLGSPAYDPPDAELATYNLAELLSEESWPSGGGLQVNLSNGSITGLQGGGNATLPAITNRRCYRTDSNEFQILARLQNNDLANGDYPKQAYCDTFLGTMMVSACDRSMAAGWYWVSAEDRWDEAFPFTLRLFSSLVGIIEEQAPGMGVLGKFWFLKDTNDVLDMFMMTFADVDQMHGGKPVLAGQEMPIMTGDQVNYHIVVRAWVWIGIVVVLMRAVATIDVVPLVWLMQWAGCQATPEDLQTPVDAALSLMFIEAPYLVLRWIAWYYYGVPVSPLAVKNVLGVLQALHLLGVMHGFAGVRERPRGLQLCFRCLRRRRDRDAAGEEAGGGAPEPELAATAV